MLTTADMSKEALQRLELAYAMTPGLASADWRDLDSAPKDGTEIELRVVHINAAYVADQAEAVREGWIACVKGHWIDHNGGGWTWHGLCGRICQWRPIYSLVTGAPIIKNPE